MTTPKKKCSSCTSFLKWRNDGEKGSSLCQYHDGRTDSGNVCENWKGKKYERKPLVIANATWNYGWWNGTIGV